MNFKRQRKVKLGLLSSTFILGVATPIIACYQQSQSNIQEQSQINGLLENETRNASFTMSASQTTAYLNGNTFNLSNDARARMSDWTALSANELALKLNSDVFANYYFQVDPSLATYDIEEAVLENGAKPGYLKIKISMTNPNSDARYATHFYVSNFLNNNEMTLTYDANKFANLTDLYLDPSKIENGQPLLPSVGEVIGTGMRNENVDGKSSYTWTGPIRREWKYLPFGDSNSDTLPAETFGVFRTYTVNAVDEEKGSAEIKVQFHKNENDIYRYFNIYGFLTKKAQAHNILDNATFTLAKPEMMWSSKNDLKAKLETTIFKTGLFPPFSNLPITYTLKSKNSTEGFLTIDAFWANSFLATFKVGNFKTSAQTTVEAIMSTFAHSYTLEQKIDFPQADIDLNTVIYNWTFTGEQKLPTQFLTLSYDYQIIMIDHKNGQMLVKVVVAQDQVKQETYFTINNFITNKEIDNQTNQALVSDITSSLANKVFALATPQKLWQAETDLNFALNHAIFANQPFPQFFNSNSVTYKISDENAETGYLVIEATITIGQYQEVITFRVENFITSDELLINQVINNFATNYTLENKINFPKADADLNALIETWVFEANQTLPIKVASLSYDYQNIMIDNEHGKMLVKVIISNGTISKETYFSISNFEDSQEHEIKQMLEIAYQDLNNHVFSLKSETSLENKKDIWENLTSEQIEEKLKADIFAQNAQIPTLNSELNYQFAIVEANWDIGQIFIVATINYQDYPFKMVFFTINNFKNNQDIIDLAFKEEEAKLAKLQLLNNKDAHQNDVFIDKVGLYLELPKLTTYQVRSTNGQKVYTHSIKREYYINIDNNLLTVDFYLMDHENKMHLMDLQFENIATEEDLNVLWVAIGVPLGITIFSLVLYLSRKYYYRHKFKKQK